MFKVFFLFYCVNVLDAPYDSKDSVLGNLNRNMKNLVQIDQSTECSKVLSTFCNVKCKKLKVKTKPAENSLGLQTETPSFAALLIVILGFSWWF
jgi:hypothetical protein